MLRLNRHEQFAKSRVIERIYGTHRNATSHVCARCHRALRGAATQTLVTTGVGTEGGPPAEKFTTASLQRRADFKKHAEPGPFVEAVARENGQQHTVLPPARPTLPAAPFRGGFTRSFSSSQL